jgi:2-polyprenyl-3-methyl-5-hydroxy-6-metoxy-1,4-benzoquinol methylase
MTEEIKSCPVCKKSKFESFLSVKDHFLSQEQFNLVKCVSCGFIFINPRPDSDEIGRYYKSEDYISHNASKKDLISRVYKAARNFSIRLKFKIVKQYANAATILDYGCGTGEFLAYCKKMGLKTVGIEPSETARTFATKHNGIVVYDKLSKIDDRQGTFDCITLLHVLEHIHDLNETVVKIKALLSPSGVLIVAVPNCTSPDAREYKSFWAAYDVPRHLYHFTEETIKTFFAGHHFTIQNILPQKLDAYYVSMLSEKYRSGKNNYLKSMLNGFRSNFTARKPKNGYSSQIYILKIEKP